MKSNSPFSSKMFDHINSNHKQKNIQNNKITKTLPNNTKAQKVNTMIGFIDYEKHSINNG